MTILKIHGTSGSGKSTAVRSLIERCPHKPIEYDWHYPVKGKDQIATILELSLPEIPKRIFVLGTYSNKCGGVDTIADVNQVSKMIDHLHDDTTHIVYEGLLTSTYYGALGEHSKKYGPDYIYAFLDTPVDVCIDRVKTRRIEAGNLKSFTEGPTREKHRTILRVKDKVQGFGHRVVTLDHEKPMFDQLFHILS